MKKPTGRKNGQKFSQEVKANVLAELMAGEVQSVIAKKYNVSDSQVSLWKKQLSKSVGANFDEIRRQTFTEKFAGALNTSLDAIIAQGKVFADPDWIRKQDAGDLAILHGILHDKTYRLVEAAQRGAEAGICSRN